MRKKHASPVGTVPIALYKSMPCRRHSGIFCTTLPRTSVLGFTIPPLRGCVVETVERSLVGQPPSNQQLAVSTYSANREVKNLPIDLLIDICPAFRSTG